MTPWIMGILASLIVAALIFVAREMREMRLLVTETFAKWTVHLFGIDGRGGLTDDVRRLQLRSRKPTPYADLEDHA